MVFPWLFNLGFILTFSGKISLYRNSLLLIFDRIPANMHPYFYCS
jgi:hypothetical protein